MIKVWCILGLLLSGCASMDVGKRLDAINAQPYLADYIAVKPYQHVELAPLIKMQDTSASSLVLRHEQHKLDRETVRNLDSALAAKTKQLELLRDAMKNIEVADRATQRSKVHLEAALEQEQRTASINDLKHSLFEIILGVLFILK